MIHDATVEVTCDECSETFIVRPDYVYNDYSGKSGHYDTSDSAIEKKIAREGWTVKDGKHFCEDCKPGDED